MPDLKSEKIERCIVESRSFIRAANNLRTKVNLFLDEKEKIGVQAEVTKLFNSMQNPTLPCASKLAEAATAAGYIVPQRAAAAIKQAEAYWDD